MHIPRWLAMSPMLPMSPMLLVVLVVLVVGSPAHAAPMNAEPEHAEANANAVEGGMGTPEDLPEAPPTAEEPSLPGSVSSDDAVGSDSDDEGHDAGNASITAEGDAAHDPHAASGEASIDAGRGASNDPGRDQGLSPAAITGVTPALENIHPDRRFGAFDVEDASLGFVEPDAETPNAGQSDPEQPVAGQSVAGQSDAGTRDLETGDSETPKKVGELNVQK